MRCICVRVCVYLFSQLTKSFLKFVLKRGVCQKRGKRRRERDKKTAQKKRGREMREDPGEEEEDGESEYGTPEARVNNDAGVLVHSPPSSSSLESYPSSSVKKKKFASSFVTNNNDEEKKKKTSRTREDPTPKSPEYSTPQMRVNASNNNSVRVRGDGSNRAASPSMIASPANNSKVSSSPSSFGVSLTKRTNNNMNKSSSSRTSNIDVSSVQSLMLANTHAVNDLHKRVLRATSHREKCITLLSNAHALQLALVEANQTHEMLDAQSLTQLKKIMISCLGLLRLCVARVDEVGNLSILEKAFTRYGILSSSSNKKFISLQSDLEIIETQLWNLTGASGGGIASKTQSIASLTRHSRLLRGGFTTAMNNIIFGSGVTEMIACGVDCSELWVANETRFPRRSGILQVTDLFLNERRELENGGRLDASSSGSSVSTSSRNKSSSDAYSKSRGIGGCFRSLEEGDEYNDDGNINAVRNGMSSLSMRVSEKPRGAITVMTKGSGVCAALLFVGTSAGDVCVWDVDLGKGNENAVMKVRKGVSATAMSIVDDEEEESNDDDDDHNDNDLVRGEEENGTNEVRASAFQKNKFQNCTLWTGFSDGSILEVMAKVKIKSRRQSSSLGNSQNTSPGDSWKFDNEVDRIAGADFEVYLRLGRLIRGEADGFGVSKRAVKFIVYLNGHVYVPYTNTTATKYANENLEVWSTKSGKRIASNEVHNDLGLVEECVAYKDAECVVTLHQAEGTFGSALGTVQLWGGRGIAPEARSAKINEIPFGSLACSVDIVEFASLLIIGHVSGHITIWKLPSTDELDAYVTKRVDERSLNLGVPGKILAHRSGMVSMCGVHAVSGSHSGVATAGTFGSVLLWPMSELESAADRAIKENGGKMRRKKRRQPSQEKLSAGLTSSRTVSQDLSPMLSKDRNGGSSGDIGKKFMHTPSEKRIASQLNTTLITQSEVALKQKIGEGSFGRVHVAVWNHVQVAVKFIGTEGMEESSDLRMAMDELEKEVSIMTNLRHPNIVALFGIIRYPPAIVEEYCARGSLFSVLQRHAKPGVPSLQWRVRLRLALGAACGMCYLHNCTPPVIHRDLKSANLMVDASFRVKVGDFNLSRVTAANRATGNSVSTSVNLHSPRWSAPEVLDTGDYSKASDVYSFGIVLWEILTLQLPWAEWSHWQVLHAVIELEERPEIPADVSPRFHALDKFIQLMRLCWSQKSVDRPTFETIIQTVQKMIESTEKFEDEERFKFKNESGTVGGAIAPRKSGSLPKSIKIFSANTNEGEKAPAPSSSRSNVVDTNKDVKSSRDDDVNNNNNEDDDDDAVVIIKDKRKTSGVAPSNSITSATKNTNNDSLTSPPSQKSSSILAGIESRKSFNTRQSRVKSPYKSPSKILRGLKSLSKSADL